MYTIAHFVTYVTQSTNQQSKMWYYWVFTNYGSQTRWKQVVKPFCCDGNDYLTAITTSVLLIEQQQTVESIAHIYVMSHSALEVIYAVNNSLKEGDNSEYILLP